MVHLTKLQRQFHDYFPEKHHWIDNPFGINMELNEENYLKKKLVRGAGSTLSMI